jgi:hypothetical protein
VGVRTEDDDRGGAVPDFFVLRPGQLYHALRCWVRHVHLAQYAVAVIGHHYATLKNIARNNTCERTWHGGIVFWRSSVSS